MHSFPVIVTGPGATRQVLSQCPELMLVRFAFEAGAEGLLHRHPHVQATFCAAGRFRFEVAGDSFEVTPGMSFTIPSGAVHGCLCLEAGVLIDAFTPRRDDFCERTPDAAR